MSDTSTPSTNASETFICDNCGEEQPLAERERFGPLYWCADCVNRADLPNDLD